MLLTWGLFSTASVAMLATLGTAVEIYDDMPPGDMELMYQDNNYIDNGPLGPEPGYEDPMRSVLLYKMLNSFRNRDVSPSVLSGPKWIPSDPELVPTDFSLSQLKGPLMKRDSKVKTVPKGIYKVAQRPQQKWKIKKGKKTGSHMICFFKLCAFRAPVSK